METYPRIWECPYRDLKKSVSSAWFTCWLNKNICPYNTIEDDYALCSKFKQASEYIHNMED